MQVDGWVAVRMSTRKDRCLQEEPVQARVLLVPCMLGVPEALRLWHARRCAKLY